jgi:hypothetical protein
MAFSCRRCSFQLTSCVMNPEKRRKQAQFKFPSLSRTCLGKLNPHLP